MIDAKAQVKSKAVEKALAGYAQTAKNRRPLMRDIASRLKTRVDMGFRQAKDPWGGKWAPLAFRNGQPLKDTGRLARSFTGQASDDEAQVGTNVCYALVHQFGTTIQAGNPKVSNVCGYEPKGAPFLQFKAGGRTIRAKEVTIPARPMLPITPDGQATLPDPWAEDVLDAVTTRMEAAANG